jgi:hypothetical protein
VKSIDPPPFSIVEVATNECSPTTPILMIITPGIDPTVELEEVLFFFFLFYHYLFIFFITISFPIVPLVRRTITASPWGKDKETRL